MTLPTEKELTQEVEREFEKVLSKWLKDQCADIDDDGNWWGYDTNVEDLIGNSTLLKSFITAQRHRAYLAGRQSVVEICLGMKRKPNRNTKPSASQNRRNGIRNKCLTDVITSLTPSK
jgi:hypothetical protein